MGTGDFNSLIIELDHVLYANYAGEIRTSSLLSSFDDPVGKYLFTIYLLNENDEHIINT